MTDTTSADRKAELEAQIARLDEEIEHAQHEPKFWQESLSDLGIERDALSDELDEFDAEEATNDA